MDAAGNAYTNLTLNWSVSGGGSLDHAVTSPAGGNDATMNAWTIGQQDGVQSITVTLPAHAQKAIARLKGSIGKNSVHHRDPDGRIYAWRPMHPNDESDLPQLMRSAIAYLRGEIHRNR
jgi:hypothetical protein